MQDGAQGEAAPQVGPGRVGSGRVMPRSRAELGPPSAGAPGRAHGHRSPPSSHRPCPGLRLRSGSPRPRHPPPQSALSPRRLGPPRGASAAPGGRDGTPEPPRKAVSRSDSPRACGSMAARGLSRAYGAESARSPLGARSPLAARLGRR